MTSRINESKSNSDTDRASLEENLRDIIQRLEKVIESSQDIVRTEPFEKLVEELKQQIGDVVAVEKDMNSIRREITGPVKREIEKSSKLGRFSFWGFWIGLIGGVLAIFSLAFNVYTIKDNENLLLNLKNSMEDTQNKIQVIRKDISSIKDKQTAQTYPLASAQNYPLTLDSIRTPDPIPSYKKLKKGEIYEDIMGDFSLLVSHIDKDNTASITINSPIRSDSGLLSVKDHKMEHFDKVSTGKSWELEGSFRKYQIVVTDIDYMDNDVSLEIKEIGRPLPTLMENDSNKSVLPEILEPSSLERD